MEIKKEKSRLSLVDIDYSFSNGMEVKFIRGRFVRSKVVFRWNVVVWNCKEVTEWLSNSNPSMAVAKRFLRF